MLENMLLKKKETEKNNVENSIVIACNYFIALIGSAIEYRKQNSYGNDDQAEGTEEVDEMEDEKIFNKCKETMVPRADKDKEKSKESTNICFSNTKSVESVSILNDQTYMNCENNTNSNNLVVIDDDDEPPSLELRIVNFIKQDKHLYEKILRFETIELTTLHTNLLLNQIKIGKKDLQVLLDEKGIINSW